VGREGEAMSEDTHTTPAPTFTAEECLDEARKYYAWSDHNPNISAVTAAAYRRIGAMLTFAASLVRREELLVAALETIRSEAAFGLSFGAGNDVGNKDAALRSIYRITTAPAKPTEAP